MTRTRPSRSAAQLAAAAGPTGTLKVLWQSRIVRLLTGAVALGAVAVILALLVFPTQAYLAQRDRISEAEATLAALRTETADLEERVAAGTDPIVVERVAREKLSLVREGDQLYRLSVDPADAVDLPGNWPLPGVRHLLTGE